MIAFIYRIENDKERLPGFCTFSYQTYHTLCRYYLYKYFPAGKYRVHIHSNKDKCYGKPDKTYELIIIGA